MMHRLMNVERLSSKCSKILYTSFVAWKKYCLTYIFFLPEPGLAPPRLECFFSSIMLKICWITDYKLSLQNKIPSGGLEVAASFAPFGYIKKNSKFILMCQILIEIAIRIGLGILVLPTVQAVGFALQSLFDYLTKIVKLFDMCKFFLYSFIVNFLYI